MDLEYYRLRFPTSRAKNVPELLMADAFSRSMFLKPERILIYKYYGV